MEEQSEELSLKISSTLNGYNAAFNKKIPANIGNFLGMVVSKFGSMHLKDLQKKYLKQFINSGAVIVNDVCDYFTQDVSVSLKNEMSSLDAQFTNVMKNFYDNVEIYERKQNVNPFDYYKYYNPVYLGMKQTLTQLHSLQDQTIVAMQKIKIAHAKLQSSLNVNVSGEFFAEVKDLYSTMEKIKKSYDNLKAIETSK